MLPNFKEKYNYPDLSGYKIKIDLTCHTADQQVMLMVLAICCHQSRSKAPNLNLYPA
jgi:hypothetical protein